MKNKIHIAAAIVATLSIATFFTSTILIEAFGSVEMISRLKNLIVFPGLLILIPTMAIVGGSGFAIAKNRKGRLITNKQKRMPFIAANGLFVLTPCAIFLSQWADLGSFDTKFYILQGIELVAGAINLTLMSLNIHDGLRLTGKLQKKIHNK